MATGLFGDFPFDGEGVALDGPWAEAGAAQQDYPMKELWKHKGRGRVRD